MKRAFNLKKIAGAEDFISGAQDIDVDKILNEFSDTPSPEELSFLRRTSERYGLKRSSLIKLFLKYPQHVEINLITFSDYYNELDTDPNTLKRIWELMKKYCDNSLKKIIITNTLPEFVFVDIANNYADQIAINYVKIIFNKQKEYKIPEILIQKLRELYPNLYLATKNRNVEEALSLITKIFSTPRIKDLKEAHEIITSLTDGYFFRHYFGSEGSSPKKYNSFEVIKEKNKENSDQAKIIEFIEAFQKEELKMIDLFKRNYSPGKTDYYKKEYLLDVVKKVISSYKNKVNYFATDVGLFVYNIYTQYGTVTNICYCGDTSVKIESIEDVLIDLENGSCSEYGFYEDPVHGALVLKSSFENKEERERFYEKYENLNDGYRESINKEENYYGMTKSGYQMCQVANGTANIDSENENFSGMLASAISFEGKNKATYEMLASKLKPFIDGSATKEQYFGLKNNLFFWMLGRLVKRDYDNILFNKQKTTIEKSDEETYGGLFYGKYVEEFYDIFKKIIKNIPQDVLNLLEEEYIAEDSHFPFKVEKSFAITCGLFSPKFVKYYVESLSKGQYSSYSDKYIPHIKTNVDNKEINEELKKIFKKEEENFKNKFDLEIGNFINDPKNAKSYKINQIPNLFEYCSDFLKMMIEQDRPEWGGRVSKKTFDDMLKQLNSIDLFFIETKKFLEFFGSDQLIKENIDPHRSRGIYYPSGSKFKRQNPVIIVFISGDSMDDRAIQEVCRVLGVKNLDLTNLTIEEEQTLWHEATHGIIDSSIGSLQKEFNYSKNQSTWLSDVEEVIAISYGEAQYIEKVIRNAVEKNFPQDVSLRKGFIEHLKIDLINNFPLEFFGRSKEQCRIDIEEYMSTTEEDILSETNIEEAKKDIISIFTSFFLSETIGGQFRAYQKNSSDKKLDFKQPRTMPEEYADVFNPNQLDEIISVLSQRKDYQDFIKTLGEMAKTYQISYKFLDKKTDKLRKIYTIYDLIPIIFDQQIYGLSDLDTSRINKDIANVIPQSLLDEIIRLINEEKFKSSVPLNLPEPEVTEEEARDLGGMIEETNRSLGKGWQWVATNNSWYKFSQNSSEQNEILHIAENIVRTYFKGDVNIIGSKIYGSYSSGNFGKTHENSPGDLDIVVQIDREFSEEDYNEFIRKVKFPYYKTQQYGVLKIDVNIVGTNENIEHYSKSNCWYRLF